MFKKERSKHFTATITKNSILNFEKRPSSETIRNFIKEGINSEILKELIFILDKLTKNKKVKKVTIRSILLDDERLYKPFCHVLEKYNYICNDKNINFIDKFSFFAVSLYTLNFRNFKKIKKKLKNV